MTECSRTCSHKSWSVSYSYISHPCLLTLEANNGAWLNYTTVQYTFITRGENRDWMNATRCRWRVPYVTYGNQAVQNCATSSCKKFCEGAQLTKYSHGMMACTFVIPRFNLICVWNQSLKIYTFPHHLHSQFPVKP